MKSAKIKSILITLFVTNFVNAQSKCDAQASDLKTLCKGKIAFSLAAAAGGGTDVLTRTYATHFNKLGFTATVENLSGGSGMVAVNSIKSNSTDTCKFVVASNSNIGLLALNPQTRNNFKMSELKPASMIATLPFVLAIRKKDDSNPQSNCFKNIDDFLKSSTSQSYGSAGEGSLGHFLGDQLFKKLGKNHQHIPYRGSSQSANALIPGEICALFESPTTILVTAKGNNPDNIIVIGSTASETFAFKKDALSEPIPVEPISKIIPSFKELEISPYVGVFASAKTDEMHVNAFEKASGCIVKSADFQNFLKDRAFVPGDGSAASLKREIDKYSATTPLGGKIKKQLDQIFADGTAKPTDTSPPRR